MDEVEELWKFGKIMKIERIMKLQEKYRLITQRVLNPNANSFVGSRKISIPSVGPKLQNGVLLLIKLKVTKRNVTSLSKMWKKRKCYEPHKEGSSPSREIRKGITNFHLCKGPPHPPFIRKT